MALGSRAEPKTLGFREEHEGAGAVRPAFAQSIKGAGAVFRVAKE